MRGVWRVREGGRSVESFYQPPSPGIFIREKGEGCVNSKTKNLNE